MKKALKWILRILLGIVVLVVLLLAGAFAVFHSSWFQDRLKDQATQLITDKLQSRITIDRVSIDLMTFDAVIEGLTVDDRQQRRMLEVKRLQADFEIWALREGRVHVRHASLDGLNAHLIQPADSDANFKFVIDAFKRDKKAATQPTPGEPKKKELQLDIRKLTLERIKVQFNDNSVELGSLVYSKGKNGRELAEIMELRTKWVRQSKRGPVDNDLRVKIIDILDMKDCKQVRIDSLCLVTNNHRSRRNAGKPKHGAFDDGHLNVVANINAQVEHMGKDSLVARILNAHVNDRGSGLDINKLSLHLAANKRTAHLKDVRIALAHTVLKVPSATIQLPSKKEGRHLAYQAPVVTGRTQLRDIARPFAPVLANFTLPLNLKVQWNGDENQMRFRNVTVNTDDKALVVRANGYINGLKDKYKLHVHFDVNRMTAQGGSKERVINQFTVKKFMMKQLHTLGRIDYTGHFDVVWKRESFAGHLNTAVGGLDFDFYIDEKTKYVIGSAQSDSLEIGKAMDVPGLGKISAKANFLFDISKPRTAVMRKRLGGKLPIGEVHAVVYDAKYKFVKVHGMDAHITSNGAVANGNIIVHGRHLDVVCSFSFTNTNEMKKMKVKPGVKWHKLSEADKAEKEERKQLKKDLKEAKKALKAEQKAAKKAAKAEAKAAKKAAEAEEDRLKAEAKAAKKAAKAEAKAAKKAAEAEQDRLKAEEKAAKKAAKAEAKAAKKAAKEAAKAAKNGE